MPGAVPRAVGSFCPWVLLPARRGRCTLLIFRCESQRGKLACVCPTAREWWLRPDSGALLTLRQGFRRPPALQVPSSHGKAELQPAPHALPRSPHPPTRALCAWPHFDPFRSSWSQVSQPSWSQKVSGLVMSGDKAWWVHKEALGCCLLSL